MAKSEWIDSEESEGRIVSFDNGSSYYDASLLLEELEAVLADLPSLVPRFNYYKITQNCFCVCFQYELSKTIFSYGIRLSNFYFASIASARPAITAIRPPRLTFSAWKVSI